MPAGGHRTPCVQGDGPASSAVPAESTLRPAHHAFFARTACSVQLAHLHHCKRRSGGMRIMFPLKCEVDFEVLDEIENVDATGIPRPTRPTGDGDRRGDRAPRYRRPRLRRTAHRGQRLSDAPLGCIVGERRADTHESVPGRIRSQRPRADRPLTGGRVPTATARTECTEANGPLRTRPPCSSARSSPQPSGRPPGAEHGGFPPRG